MKVSVLMSVYDKEHPAYLESALESLFAQTRLPDEILIVKDGPLNSPLDSVIAKYKHAYPILSVISLPENVGLGAALNHGLLHVKYDLVARMDSDDICYPTRFEQQVAFLKDHPSVSIVGAAIQEFNQAPEDLRRFRRLPSDPDQIIQFARYRNPMNHPTVMFRKMDVLAAGSYEDMPLFEDWHLWVRMIQKGYKLYNLERPLLHFRVGNDMIGRRHGFSYLKKELNFLVDLKHKRFLSTSAFLVCALAKLPLRLLPKPLLSSLYKSVLRKR
jgi:glycosyltransferase involved in cell wall biosynthesis